MSYCTILFVFLPLLTQIGALSLTAFKLQEHRVGVIADHV
jgi:hypothetical protein